jgi:Flp pilus assembly protein TadD
MHQHQKQWDEAERFYQQALNVEPDNFVALMNLGAICRQTGRLSSARDYLLRSLAVEPTATRPRDELKLVEKQELDKQKQQIPKGPVVP